MPTYEYKNIETGEIYEFKQSMRDDALTHHPETGAAIKRIVSMPAIAFKGSGFYANDSRASSGQAKRAQGAESGSTSATSGDSSQTSEARSSDSKSSDSKAPESKGSESKAADPKSSGESSNSAKPAEKASPAAARAKGGE